MKGMLLQRLSHPCPSFMGIIDHVFIKDVINKKQVEYRCPMGNVTKSVDREVELHERPHKGVSSGVSTG